MLCVLSMNTSLTWNVQSIAHVVCLKQQFGLKVHVFFIIQTCVQQSMPKKTAVWVILLVNWTLWAPIPEIGTISALSLVLQWSKGYLKLKCPWVLYETTKWASKLCLLAEPQMFMLTNSDWTFQHDMSVCKIPISFFYVLQIVILLWRQITNRTFSSICKSIPLVSVCLLECQLNFSINKPCIAQTGVSNELIHSTNRRWHEWGKQ